MGPGAWSMEFESQITSFFAIDAAMRRAPCSLLFYAAFETLTAQTLYSGIPEIGSKAAFVSRLAAAWA